MRVLLDSDVVLDFVLDRKPFAEPAAALFEMYRRGSIDCYVSGITIVNVFYVTRKLKGIGVARLAVEGLLAAMLVCPVERTTLYDAYRLAFSDYEDAVQHACAAAARLDALVTRNLEDYKNATLPVFSPKDFLDHLKAQQP